SPGRGRRAHRASTVPGRPVRRPRATHGRARGSACCRADGKARPSSSWRTPTERPIGKLMEPQGRPLRRGWTTGACATAAARAAYQALVTGVFPDPVAVTLPRGAQPCFALAVSRTDEHSATAGIVKDAGDDPDVTHGALVLATVRAGAPGSG